MSTPDTRAAARETVPCPPERGCGQPVGKVCRTVSGKVATVHVARVDAYGGWLLRQAEVDAVEAVVAGLSQEVRDHMAEIDTLTADLAAANAEIARLKAQVPVPEPEPTSTFDLGMAYRSNADPAPVEKRLGWVLDSRRTYWGATQQAKAVEAARVDRAAGRRCSSLSFKPPLSWAQMAAGDGDKWATDLRDHLVETGQSIRLAIAHEPEGDGPVADWKAMQVHLAPIFDVPGIQYVVIFTGYHQYAKDSGLYAQWNIEAAFPDSPHIKGVGYDLYQSRGVVKDGKTKGWRDLTGTYIPRIKAFHDAHRGLPWGFSEHSWTAAAETERPGQVHQLVAAMKAAGGQWLEHFNSNLNSVATWEMEPDGPREKSLAALK